MAQFYIFIEHYLGTGHLSWGGMSWENVTCFRGWSAKHDTVLRPI